MTTGTYIYDVNICFFVPVLKPTDEEIKTTRELIRSQFEKNTVEAANHFGCCPPFFKKVYTQYDITRWPYRKFLSIEKTIEKINQEIAGEDNLFVLKSLQEKLEIAQQGKIKLLQNPNLSLKSQISASFRQAIQPIEKSTRPKLTKKTNPPSLSPTKTIDKNANKTAKASLTLLEYLSDECTREIEKSKMFGKFRVVG